MGSFRACCNKAKSGDAKQPQYPSDKERVMVEAPRFYVMIP